MKQETLEEAKNICIQTGLPCGMQCLSEDACDRTLEEAVNNFKKTDVYTKEIKQEQEKSYSEEDMAESFMACWKANVPEGFECKLSFNEWFEQFKKK